MVSAAKLSVDEFKKRGNQFLLKSRIETENPITAYCNWPTTT